jgi:hypothetical protein
MPIENKEKSIQNGLHTLFEGLNNIIDQEAAQKYEQVKDILKIDISSPEKFYFTFTLPIFCTKCNEKIYKYSINGS